MRPWEREQPSSPPPDSPPRPSKGSLSSMVVKPSDDEVARGRDEVARGRDEVARGRDDASADPDPAEPRRRRDEITSPPRRPRSRRFPEDSGHYLSVRSTSPSHRQRTEDRHYDHYFDRPSPPQGRWEFGDRKNSDEYLDHAPTYVHDRGRINMREVSPPYARVTDGGRFRKYSTIDGHGRGGGRFRQTQFGRGRGRSFRDHSPPTFERERGGQRDLSPGYEKGRGRGRLRDISPSYGPDRGGRRFRDISPVYVPERSGGSFRGISSPYSQRKDTRIFDRNLNGSGSESLPFRDESTNRNNPNIPPRVGDWICRNPSCGNLNFARREYCNNCNKFRYEPGEDECSSSPHRQYSGGRSLDPPPIIRPVGRSLERETNGYKSPPRGWARDNPRGPPPRLGGRFSDIRVRREIVDYRDDTEYRGRGKFDRLLPHEWDHQEHGHDEFLQERRGYDRDNNSWGPRERSRSPVRVQPPKDSHNASFGGRGRGDRRGFARGRGRDLF